MSIAPKQNIQAISSISDEKTSPTLNKKGKGTDDVIKERISSEIIISLCGAVGSLTEEFRSSLKSSLTAAGYKTVHIKISDLLPQEKDKTNEADRITSLQNKGNHLREKHGSDYLAKLAIKRISTERSRIIREEKEDIINDAEQNKTKCRIAYIIDQLKHPSEVFLFRLVYPQNFYLLTIIRTEKERRIHLEEKRIQSEKIDDIIRRDRKEKDKTGQQVEKTAVLADYFIRNQHDHARNINKEIDRFVKLIHGAEGMSPRRDEKAMMTAYFASLQSACLSRQVGAAITDEDGRVLSTGRNDVPEYPAVSA
ncbi:hypothetical protein [Parathalassolituus penaei]|uniref:CMP/dCMP-type deaminase domain-containing protein n=1 Tax=Parathalassolituus penaei TaxID=2997323 RepID=A0A9X3EE90_9GAMM|nr:hypothetical protein [Parathalassolituus penaei]MCY0965591.1 hypothetical protein [Parathalassolituus penaei]